MRSQSASVVASGFSTRTARPLLTASTTASAWAKSGVTMLTASSSSRASMRRKSV